MTNSIQFSQSSTKSIVLSLPNTLFPLLIHILNKPVLIVSFWETKNTKKIQPRLWMINILFHTIHLYSPQERFDFLWRHRILWISKNPIFSVFHFYKPPKSIFCADNIELTSEKCRISLNQNIPTSLQVWGSEVFTDITPRTIIKSCHDKKCREENTLCKYQEPLPDKVFYVNNF